MKIVNQNDTLPLLCKTLNKFGMRISFQFDHISIEESFKAIPFLNKEEHNQIWVDGGCMLLFDTADEMVLCFNNIVGDDGPTILNGYSGEARVYALTCDNKGEYLNENT